MILHLQQHLWMFMLLTLALGLFSGLPVALVQTGVGFGFGLIGCALHLVRLQEFQAIYYRIFGTLFDTEDVFWSAVPLLLFMGMVLHESGIASEMQTCLQRILRRFPGGLALSALVMGALLAPAAGMIGASVVTLSLIALPEMMDRGYRPAFASGAVAAAGTLGVALPPGVMLVFVADAMGIYTPYIFLGMVGPGLLLMILYGAWCMVAGSRESTTAPAMAGSEGLSIWKMIRGVFLPAALIGLMLLSVTVGNLPIAEAAAVGGGGSLLLSLFSGRLQVAVLRRVVVKTALITAMVFFIFMGASVFNLMFRLIGGVDAVGGFLAHLRLGSWATLGAILAILFLLGFFVDWIELVMVSFAIFRPALDSVDFSASIPAPVLAYTWVTVLITMTLQVSFMTPPFGYALFFLKGSAPQRVRMKDVYRGIVPFVVLTLLAIGCVARFPEIATWLPGRALSQDVVRKVEAID